MATNVIALLCYVCVYRARLVYVLHHFVQLLGARSGPQVAQNLVACFSLVFSCLIALRVSLCCFICVSSSLAQR